MMDLCHLFVFALPREAEILGSLGFVESYRRKHPGQGTSNACFCFDNAYLELLFVEDEKSLAALRRTGLAERSKWRGSGASPFGIAIRSTDDLPFPTWDYRPTYLPDGMVIAVDRQSDDPQQPFVFRSPGSQRPDLWTNGLAGQRQTRVGCLEIMSIDLFQPMPSGRALETLTEAGLVNVHSDGEEHRVELLISRKNGGSGRLKLPSLEFRLVS